MKSPILSILTPTGARSEAFAKCAEYMQAQDYKKPVRWVIVDDGPEAMPTPRVGDWQIVHARPEPFWQPGQNTQARNLLAGLDYCTDRIAIIEDDDAYSPDWLSTVSRWLDDDDLVGEGESVYRNLKTGTVKECGNTQHASLCSTAVKGQAVEWLRQACETGEKFIDLRLWKNPGKVYPHQGGVIGLKGYPGRPGIGMGHRI